MKQQFHLPILLHGGDYNPEQWLKYPEILKQDIKYFKEAHINTVTLGVFSWSFLEPKAGEYNFDWLENIINNLYEHGISVILATPSGARPKWLADKYPEVLRVSPDRHRKLFGGRHNHCFTSPVYREKTRAIDMALAKRFGNHPAIILWHISNEVSGECHCPLCQEAFRGWLKAKFKTIETLNDSWCTAFWSHVYSDFSEIESPSPAGESELHGLALDWKRFVTYQTIDFFKHEVSAVYDGGSSKPVTANFMYDFPHIDYHKFKDVLDIVSFDNYPMWHKREETLTAMDSGMQYDLMRSIKMQPFLLMESSPSTMNWQQNSKLKRPGILKAASLQAVAHGSDSVLYFQLRQSRGASEKFHGAVIDHYGGNDTRVFREVTEVGESLLRLQEIAGSTVYSKAAILYDWNNRWALEDAQGPRNQNLYYKECVQKSYSALRKQGINVDLIDLENDLSSYKLIVAPMQYLYDISFTERIRTFVKNGGTFLMTYWSGIVDENDRCYLGGTPGMLMDVMGLRSEEIDGLYDHDRNYASPIPGNSLGLTKTYECKNLCELVKLSTAKPLLVYNKDFYAGYPVFAKNNFGLGNAYYVCADLDAEFYDDIYPELIKEAQIKSIMDHIPYGIEVTTRMSDTAEYIFIQNFTDNDIMISLPLDVYTLFYGNYNGFIEKYDTVILKRDR